MMTNTITGILFLLSIIFLAGYFLGRLDKKKKPVKQEDPYRTYKNNKSNFWG